MASTTALFTGLSGLAANSRALDVIGNNVANVNTTAFKSNRMIFAPTFSRNFSLGTAPSTTSGGTNPGQIGLGVSIAGTQRNFNNGSISATGVATDVAIEGDGFFIVERAGERFFTRAGAFQRNQNNDLVTISGEHVMGFGVDTQFQIIEGNLVELNIPVGTLTLAEASRNVTFNGNVNASGVVASTGSVHNTRQFFTDALLTPGMEMLGTEDLTVLGTDLYIDDGAGGSFLAIEGGRRAIVTLDGIEKGGKDMGTATFGFMTAAEAAAAGVDDFGSTMNDFLTFLDEVLGLDSTVISTQDLGGRARISTGAVGDPPAGTIIIEGNEGTVQDLEIDTADLVVTYDDPLGVGINQPYVMTKIGDADGESVRTSFVVFDSLGSPLTVDLTFVLQETVPGSGTVWEFVAESLENDALERVVGLGVVTFDSNGRFVSATNQAFSLARTNGAVSPLTVSMDFDSGTDAITALTDAVSTLAAVFQDGSPIGTLSNFSIGEDGIIAGSFTNGLVRNIGQVVLSKFSNPEGLVDAGSNLFSVGPNSGTPLVAQPLQFGTGRLLGGSLELSNVDLS
ncbi:MAG: flagellar hook-basal body complex protein, partial [Planctomycetota bacterium]